MLSWIGETQIPFNMDSGFLNNMPCVLQISSIIEIEVEMDSDVLAAEAAGNAVRIISLEFRHSLLSLITCEDYNEVVIHTISFSLVITV